jgi:predicted GIY-YIG superfamily endonuclease
MPFILYILKCRDGSLYTGITSNLRNRLAQHSCGRGSKYVRSRLPFRLVYTETLPDRSRALKRELQVKALSKPEKDRLISGFKPQDQYNPEEEIR